MVVSAVKALGRSVTKTKPPASAGCGVKTEPGPNWELVVAGLNKPGYFDRNVRPVGLDKLKDEPECYQLTLFDGFIELTKGLIFIWLRWGIRCLGQLELR